MTQKELPKPIKVGAFKSFMIFNLAAVIGFLLGTVSFTISIFLFHNDTFAWLFANAIGGISHFGANYVMQRQTKEKIAKNFIVFNATGTIGFLTASVMFAFSIILIGDSNASWLIASAGGTLIHYLFNTRAQKINFNMPKNLNLSGKAIKKQRVSKLHPRRDLDKP